MCKYKKYQRIQSHVERFQVLTAMNTKMAVTRVAASCSLVKYTDVSEVLAADDGGSKHL
jgi:hypothetical protein